MPDKKSSTFLIFVLTIIFYVYTLLPSLAWGDGTKLQGDVIAGESFILAEMSPEEFSPDPFIFSKVGVAAWDHPLYIIMGNILVRSLPFVDSLWLVNFISAIFGAASVALLFLISYRFTESVLASCYASLSLAVSHTFWWHSSTPEVYTLLVFLLLISFYFFDKFDITGKYIFLVYSAFFFGLAASNHILAFLAIPALGFHYLISKTYLSFHISDLKRLLAPFLGFLAGFSVYIIQFVRISANFSPAEMIRLMAGTTFLSQVGTFSPILLGESFLSYLFFLTLQFGPTGLIFGVLGIRKIYLDKDLTLKKIVSFFIVFALFGIFYRVTDQFTFFITSYVFWAMWIGIGSLYAFSLIPQKKHFLLSSILGAMLFATPFFYTTLPLLAERIGLNDATMGVPKIGTDIRNGFAYYINPYKRRDFNAYNFGSQTILSLEPNSVVIAEWYTDTDEYFIFRYFTKIQKSRSDVTVVGWPTEEPFSFNPQLVFDVIETSLPEHPVYLASLSERFYAASKLLEMYCIVPQNNLYRLYQRGNESLQCLGNDSITE